SQSPISIATNDPYDTDPGNFSITGGSVTISTVSLRVARAATTVSVTDNDGTSPNLVSATSASFIVAHSTAAKLQIVLPGEAPQPGNQSLVRGVTGTPSAAQAGVNIPVQVRIVDNFWNLAFATSSVRLTSSDPYDQSTGPWVGFGKDP